MSGSSGISAQDLAQRAGRQPSWPDRAPTAWRPVLLVTAAAVAIHLAVATRYGWHHDEFYYVVAGRHPAWGYVDQPPLAPFLARLAAALPAGCCRCGCSPSPRRPAAWC